MTEAAKVFRIMNLKCSRCQQWKRAQTSSFAIRITLSTLMTIRRLEAIGLEQESLMGRTAYSIRMV